MKAKAKYAGTIPTVEWALRVWTPGSVKAWASVPELPCDAGGVTAWLRLAWVPMAWWDSDASEWSAWVNVAAAAEPESDGRDPV